MPTRHTSLLALLPSLTIALSTGVVASANAAAAATSYAASSAGAANVQASVQPVTRACPASADWLRDPNVCAQRWSSTGNDKSESDLAVDPTNPDHLVGLSKVFFSPHDYVFNLEWYDSEDGGRTWSNGLLPGYDSWAATTDPTLAFDSEGNLYALVLAFNFVIERSGSHNWSVGQTEPTHLNDAVYLSRSLKGKDEVGRTWEPPVTLATYASGGLGVSADKQWVAADLYGNHPGSVYAAWIRLDGASFSGEDVFALSTDYGATFTSPASVASGVSPHFPGDPYVLTGPEGNLYYSFDLLPPKQSYGTSAFGVMVSHDNGASFSRATPSIFSTIADQSGQSLPDSYRDGTPYTLTADPLNGHLFLAYERYGGGTPARSQWLAESSDAGTTWTSLGQVDDPAGAGQTTQAKIMSAGSGIVALAFYDRRLACPADDPIAADVGALDTCIDVTIQFFDPNGVRLGGNRRVTRESWDPNVNPAFPGGLGASTSFIGDYFGGAMTTTRQGTFAHLLFVSTSPRLQAGAVPGGDLSPPYQQQVYATVPVP
ncbi:MAG: exo-alpha-sialidase [Chloroflexi bacterium]|nr:MAG: exo-alpha-sialidase [Chloroflexota bacterium]